MLPRPRRHPSPTPIAPAGHLRLGRRAFLGGALGVGAGLVIVACGGDDDDAGSGGAAGTGGTVAVDPGLTAVQANAEIVPGTQRVAFGVLRNQPDGSFVQLAGDDLLVGFSPVADGRSPEPTSWMPMAWHVEGLPPTKGYYVATTAFDHAGVWEAWFRTGDLEGRSAFNVLDPAAQPLTPQVGAPAPTVATPTVADPLGVDPLCTRTDAAGNPAPCPLHDTLLPAVLGTGRPVVVTFSTPARCVSQVCGPTLELILGEAPNHPDVSFVHVEIYRDAVSNEHVGAIDRAQPGTWSLSSEPWLFAVDGQGIVQAKLEGVFDLAEIRQLVATVAPS